MRVEDWYFVEIDAKLIYSIKAQINILNNIEEKVARMVLLVQNKIISCHHLNKNYLMETKIKKMLRNNS